MCYHSCALVGNIEMVKLSSIRSCVVSNLHWQNPFYKLSCGFQLQQFAHSSRGVSTISCDLLQITRCRKVCNPIGSSRWRGNSRRPLSSKASIAHRRYHDQAIGNSHRSNLRPLVILHWTVDHRRIPQQFVLLRKLHKNNLS